MRFSTKHIYAQAVDDDKGVTLVFLGTLAPELRKQKLAANLAGAKALGVACAAKAKAAGLDLIRLVAPTTDEARLPRVLRATSGFVYYVSITGITGTRSASSASLAEAMPRIRRHTELPVCIGFGIRTPQQAAEAAKLADGAVVGTALVDTLAASLDEDGRARPETVRQVLDQVRGLAEAIRAG